MRLLLTFLLIFSSLYAYEMEEEYSVALQKAKVEHKPLLAYLYMLNCDTCEYMNKIVFTNPEVIAYLDKHYVVVHLYTNSKDLPVDFRVKVSPVFHFLNSSNGEMLESIIGGRKPKKFLRLLRSSYGAYLDEQKKIDNEAM